MQLSSTLSFAALLLGTILFASNVTAADEKPKAAQLAVQPAGQPAGPSASPSPAVSVKAVTVTAGVMASQLSAVGSLRANEQVMLRPEIAGRIAAIHFAEGQPVAAGAKLLTLAAEEQQAQTQSAIADAQINAQRATRAEELHQKGFISKQALDEARSNRARSAAIEAESRARLAKTEIRAPFAGVMGLRHVSPGDYVQPGKDLAQLDDIRTIKLDFRLPELQLAKIKPGQAVSVQVDAYPQKSFNGKVYAIESAVNEATRTLLVRAKIPNPDHALRAGLFARVSLDLGINQHALIVPEQAIVPKGRDSFVFKVVEGKAKLTLVATGNRRPGFVEVIGGVAAGDVVVTEGQMKIQDGMAVSVVQ